MRLIVLLLSYVITCGAAWSVEVALTFDDFPMATSPLMSKRERVLLYKEKLDKLNLRATFFCIGEQLQSEEELQCLAEIAPFHIVANHSFSHLHLSEIALKTFEEELIKTDTLLNQQPHFRKWFRFPYLDYGDRYGQGGNSRKRCAAFALMRQAGYQHGYVTINTFDWYVDGQLKKAVREKQVIHWDKLKEAYLSLLDGWLSAYHERWSQVYRKPFVHVVLFHQNDLNALFLEDIVALIAQKEWKVVSADCAFEAPIPYLAHFANTQVRLFKSVPSLSTAYIDKVLLAHNVFEVPNE